MQSQTDVPLAFAFPSTSSPYLRLQHQWHCTSAHHRTCVPLRQPSSNMRLYICMYWPVAARRRLGFFDGVCAARAIRNAVWQLSPFKPGLRNRGVPNVLEWGDEPDDPKVTFSDNSSPRQLALLCLALPCLAHACSSSPSSLAISSTLLVFCFQSLAPALPCLHSAPNHPTSTPVNAKLPCH